MSHSNDKTRGARTPQVELPIDDQRESVRRALARSGGTRLVIEAPPGAGKTTRVPAWLLEEEWCTGKILVSEPRRIAARLAATRVAAEQGSTLGDQIGYQVRFDDKTSAHTKLIYLTEGLLLRQLLDSRELPGVSAVVLDEVHERSADLDLLLALLKQLQESRPELRLVLMSATLDAGHFAAYLGEAQMIESRGRAFDVEIRHAPKDDERPLAIQVRSAVKEAYSYPGDILVFLPGAGEIRACGEALEGLGGFDVIPLHGDLPIEQQARAISEGGATKRVILSTNVAESSVTIPGVTTVIDSGLARMAIFDPWSGVSRLETVPISQARCVQRSGRAGRVAPGQALRLFTKGRFESRPAQDRPEILRSDLSSVYLSLKAAGHEPTGLPWLSPPPPEAWAMAKSLLTALQAMSGEEITPAGRAMSALGLPTRVARVAVEGWIRGVPDEACLAAALLAERDILLSARSFRQGYADVEAGDSDLDVRLDRFSQLSDSRFDRRLARDLEMDLQGAKQIDKIARSTRATLQKAAARLPRGASTRGALERALLAGFVDRVATRRSNTRELVLANGTQATLHESSCVIHAQLLIALSADAPGGRQRRPQVRIACRIDPDWLLDAAADLIEASDDLEWNQERERVEQVSRLCYGKVILDESKSRPEPSERVAEILAKSALSRGPAVFDPDGLLESLFVRLNLLFERQPEIIAACSDEEQRTLSLLFSDSETEGQKISEGAMAKMALSAAAQSRTSIAELREARLVDELDQHLPPKISAALRRDLPEQAKLAGGKLLPIHYEKGRTPWVESRLQDFFSMEKGPIICAGRLPLQLHLLAPNKRAVQVTTDLGGFWERHYPDLRKQLMRRYPRHLWPEDGRLARPPTPGKIR